MTRMTPGPWFTDGLIVWAHSAAGRAICASRNLKPREGTLAPVEDGEEQRANMAACAAVPALVEALQDFLTMAERATDGYDIEPHPIEQAVMDKARAALALLESPAPAP